MQKSKRIYNASVEILSSTDEARVIRVYPDSYKIRFKPGQYGSLGLISDIIPEKLLKRAFCISSSMIDLLDDSLINEDSVDYFEFYFNKVPIRKREQLTPKLFDLENNDRIFCGEKIVGYYTPERINTTSNVLFVGSETGEAPNNSIITHLLKRGIGNNICNLTIGEHSWESLYTLNHKRMMGLYDNYIFHCKSINDFSEIETFIRECLYEERKSIDFFGFPLVSETTHVFLSGDPVFIGAPKKKGRWEFEESHSGLIPILESEGFQLSSRFKQGNIEYECYW